MRARSPMRFVLVSCASCQVETSRTRRCPVHRLHSACRARIARMTLVDAIKARDLAAARAALADAPSSAGTPSPEGSAPICLAMYYRAPDIAEAIAAAKGDLDIFEAIVLGREDRVAALLDADPATARAVAADGFPTLGL